MDTIIIYQILKKILIMLETNDQLDGYLAQLMILWRTIGYGIESGIMLD